MTQPTRLHFSIGGYGADGAEIELLPSSELQIRGTDLRLFDPPQTLRIRPERWQTFWREIETIGIWNWKKEYPGTILDSTQWELELSHADRQLHTTGNNAYPESEGDAGPDLEYPADGQFARFLTALRTLTQVPLSF